MRSIFHWWTNLCIRNKGFVVVALPFAALLLTQATNFILQHGQRDEEAWVTHTLQAIAQITHADRRLIESELSLRNFILTRNQSDLKEYQQAYKEAFNEILALRTLLADNPVQVQAIERLKPGLEKGQRNIQLIAAKAKSLYRQNETTRALEPLILQNATNLQTIRDSLAAMQAEEQRLLTLRVRLLEQRSAYLDLVTLIGAILGIAGGLLAVELFTTGIAQRINRLERQAMEVATGAPVHAENDARDELGNLSHQLGETSKLLLKREQELREALRQAEEARKQSDQARTLAERANQAKSEFLSRMSHELRTPLNAILGFGQLLEMGSLAPAQSKNVKQILEAGRHLLRLINEVLDLSRVEAGRMELERETVRLPEVINEAIAMVRPIAAQYNIGIDTMSAGAMSIVADRQRLLQVLINLLSNAIKYNRTNGRVCVSYERGPQDQVRIIVRDTGHGINEENLQKLFTPFERLDAGKTHIEGTGLGLALSWNLIEAMGGVLGVESVVGEGSTFFIELPIEEDAQQLPVQPVEINQYPEPAPSGDKPRMILYIEDNLANDQLIDQVLEHRQSINLLHATHGRDGLDQARQHKPDLILLDLHLPDMNGQEVLRELCTSPVTQEIPVVVVTADVMGEYNKQILEAGAKAFVTKPLDIPEFLHTIDCLLYSKTTSCS